MHVKGCILVHIATLLISQFTLPSRSVFILKSYIFQETYFSSEAKKSSSQPTTARSRTLQCSLALTSVMIIQNGASIVSNFYNSNHYDALFIFTHLCMVNQRKCADFTCMTLVQISPCLVKCHQSKLKPLKTHISSSVLLQYFHSVL